MFWICLVVVGVIAVFALDRYGLIRFLVRQPRARRGDCEWLDKGSTPLGEQRYTPQGMTIANGRILLANSWKDTRSRVYEFSPESMEPQRWFDMPSEAVHTSGLAWDGQVLWAVDFISNRAYRIDLEASFTSNSAVVLGSFDSTLRGTSACCCIHWDGTACLAISDFMNSQRTLFVRIPEAVQEGTAKQQIIFSYQNEGFSQGLEFAQGYLFESENKWGTNVINQLDLALLRSTRVARSATVVQYAAPGKGVEDLAWDGTHLWTSDEMVFRFFRGKLDMKS